ncbi:hypothetical protein [Sphingorhabdus sp. Alg231-15]|uniref:hypothetical protein n=1 Tax=Sphingorhabdus sp. Alg231-15 TaxID=1922222 RepID=UPI000D560B83
MSKGYFFAFALIGAILWFIAAMIIQFFPDMFLGGTTGMILFLISIPGTWITVYLMMKVTGLQREHIFSATCVGAVTAMFLDGVAITWLPQLYGGTGDHLANGAAWLLFGVALFMTCAAIIGRQKAS